MTTRFPAQNVEVGPFVAKIDFNPATGAPHAVFIIQRAKSGTDLEDFLYTLSTEISKVMQGKP